MNIGGINLFALTSLLCGALCALLCVFAWISGKKPIYRLLSSFNVAVSLWGFGCFKVATAATQSDSIFGWKIAHVGGFIVSALFYHLISLICRIRRPKLIFLAYLQGIVFNVINFSSNIMINRTRPVFGFLFLDWTPVMTAAFCFYLLFVFLSYAELSKYLRSASGNEKRQAQFVFYGFLVGFAGGTTVLLPEFHIDLLYPAGNAGVCLYASVVTYAVLYHRILDLEVLAQAAHRSKLADIGTLATSINHEIRNPLYVIQGLAESHLTNLEDGIYANQNEIVEKSSEILKKTAEQATRAMEIMRNFAMFAKKEISQEAQTESVHLNEMLEGILPLISHEMELDKIEFVRNIPAELSPVKVDRRHLEEILFNLIVNACQAMKIQINSCQPETFACHPERSEGSQDDNPSKHSKNRIEITAAQHNGAVHIKVEDNGPGISPKQLSQIFEPFYTTKSEGTGLGLYVTKQLIEKNGGRICVKSKLGRGTQFHLEFRR